MASKSSKPGAATTAPAENNGFSLISNATLIALYGDLLHCQRVAAGSFDAVTAGVMMDLNAEDAVALLSSDATVSLKRADKPAVAGKSAVKDQLEATLGAALLSKTRNSAGKGGKVGVVFGDSSTPEWQDAQASARAHALPLIFVSRAKAVDERAEEKALAKAAKNGKPTKKELSEGHLPRILVDADDVVAVYRVAHESIDRARRGRGPSWIEGVPFRPEGGKGSADAVKVMEAYLTGKGLFRVELKQELLKAKRTS